ncbi:hypothetical protein PISL3812_04224 [Talaromyces islandicus]|uniref:Uncharacterized protein n=1 Tax=Talaromyces islandicus TaxID=28573 RepID=A0A0U1LUX9_TALIS|nr:hypothetical protein PISL3812_04224 [Talaromyces islandicus]
MLMQSALPCDSRKYLSGPLYRALSPTPPPCDGISGSLMGVSRKLQTLLNVPSGPAPATPPRSMRLASPFHLDEPKPTKSRLRLRSRSRSRRTTPKSATPKPKTPSPQPPRGRHKRSRSNYENGDSDSETDKASSRPRDRYSTPKRQKRFPYNMPLGLGISDFEALEEPIALPHRNILPAADEALPDVVLPSIEWVSSPTPVQRFSLVIDDVALAIVAAAAAAALIITCAVWSSLSQA